MTLRPHLAVGLPFSGDKSLSGCNVRVAAMYSITRRWTALGLARDFIRLDLRVEFPLQIPPALPEGPAQVARQPGDELVEITGAFSVEWTRKLDCCGAPLTGINDRLAMDMAAKKIASAREAGANYLCTACPYTHIQFDWVQNRMAANSADWQPLAPILYPQLLGLCMGIDETTLGLSNNRLELSDISSFLMTE